jgi:hypothetical protein
MRPPPSRRLSRAPARRPAIACLLALLAGLPALAQPANLPRPETQPPLNRPAGQPADPAADPAAQPQPESPALAPPEAPRLDPDQPRPLGRDVPWPPVTIEQALSQPVPCPPSEGSVLLERAALLDLRLQPTPSLEDYELAALALEVAAALRPDDPDLWRRVAEAAFNTGDQATLERATRQIVRLDPADTVAQLRLIAASIGRLQTGQERLAAYERLIGPAGVSLDPAVRSRLALDAAVLAREVGDDDAFARLLTTSTELDSSHKEAAALALAYFQAAVPDDPIGRLQLLCNLLLADPLDPHVHLAIAGELSSHAAFDQAARFHTNARAVIGASDPELAAMLDVRGLLLNWQLTGPEVVVEALNQRLATLRHQAAFNVALKQAQHLAIRDEERPENTRLPRQLEIIRLLAADAAGFRDVAAASAQDLSADALAVVQYYQRPENQPTGDAGRELARRIADMWVETLIVRAWSSGDMEALAADLQQSIDQMGNAIDLTEAQAWFGLRTGQQDAVIDFFEATQDTLYRSRLGYAMALEAQGRQEEAVAVYTRVAREDPGAVQSAWARSRLLFMTGQDLARTEHHDRVIEIARTVPAAIDKMLLDPTEFARLHVSVADTSLAPLDHAAATVTLTNRGTMPLAVGSVRPIDSRFLLSPQARVGSIPVIGAIQPEILDLDRRLRLRPGESITARLPLAAGFTDAFMQTQCASRTGVSWRAIQGFRVVNDAYVAGPLCLTATTPEIIREPLLLARLTPQDLAAAAAQAAPEQLPAVARAAWGAGLSESYGRKATPEQLTALAAALGERYQSADSATRLILLAGLPTAALSPGFEAFDDAVRATIASETDPAVLMAALLTRATAADDPVLAACRASPEPALSRAAVIQARRLVPDSPSNPLSTTGPGLATLIGPALPSLRGVVE